MRDLPGIWPRSRYEPPREGSTPAVRNTAGFAENPVQRNIAWCLPAYSGIKAGGASFLPAFLSGGLPLGTLGGIRAIGMAIAMRT
jgi:hypothetical protein